MYGNHSQRSIILTKWQVWAAVKDPDWNGSHPNVSNTIHLCVNCPLYQIDDNSIRGITIFLHFLFVKVVIKMFSTLLICNLMSIFNYLIKIIVKNLIRGALISVFWKEDFHFQMIS